MLSRLPVRVFSGWPVSLSLFFCFFFSFLCDYIHTVKVHCVPAWMVRVIHAHVRCIFPHIYFLFPLFLRHSDSKGNPRCITNSKGRKRRPGSKDLTSILKNCDPIFVNFVSRCLEWVFEIWSWRQIKNKEKRFNHYYYFQRWDPNRRMTPDEAHRHEWFAGAATSATTSSGTVPPTSSTGAEEASGGQKCCAEDSEGVFSASSTGSTSSGQPQTQQQQNGGGAADRSIMYQIFKSKKSSTQSQQQDQPDEASQQLKEGVQQLLQSSPPTGGAGAARNSKRIDGNSNLDDSGTYLPSIL